jgi:hypothetical protein
VSLEEVRRMAEAIDVGDLPEEEAELVREFVQFLRERMERKKEAGKRATDEGITFGSWPLGVKGKLTREEIYDYL